MQDFYDENGNAIPIQDLPRDVSAAIKKYNTKITRLGKKALEERVIELVDKKGSLETLGKYFSLWNEKVEIGAGSSVLDLINQLQPTLGPMKERGKIT